MAYANKSLFFGGQLSRILFYLVFPTFLINYFTIAVTFCFVEKGLKGYLSQSKVGDLFWRAFQSGHHIALLLLSIAFAHF